MYMSCSSQIYCMPCSSQIINEMTSQIVTTASKKLRNGMLSNLAESYLLDVN